MRHLDFTFSKSDIEMLGNGLLQASKDGLKTISLDCGTLTIPGGEYTGLSFTIKEHEET